MRFACLGSGSEGNGLLVEVDSTRVLVDCGFGVRDTVARLSRIGVAAETVTAIVVTHEHSDHIGGVAAFAARPFPVPHDAREPVQFVCSDGNWRLGVLTDLGTSTAYVESSLSGCDALVLECNHDLDMLANGDYPYPLKQRIAGRFGHLDNGAAAGLLTKIDTSRLKHLIAAHLSQHNNRPELARAALAEAIGCAGDWIGIADQQLGFDWREFT